MKKNHKTITIDIFRVKVLKPPEVVDWFSMARWKGLEVPRRIGGVAMGVPKPIRGRTRKTVKIRGIQISAIGRSRKVFLVAFESSRGTEVIGM